MEERESVLCTKRAARFFRILNYLLNHTVIEKMR